MKDIGTLRVEILSSDIEVRGLALNEVVDLMKDFAKTAVDSLLTAPPTHRLVIFERLALMGSITAPYAERVLDSSIDSELKYMIALLLILFGNKRVIPLLMESVTSGSNHGLLGARRLVQNGIMEAEELVIQRLRMADIEKMEDLGVMTWLDILKEAKGQLPDDLRVRLSKLSPRVEKEIKDLFG